jgi:hypothetical protein
VLGDKSAVRRRRKANDSLYGIWLGGYSHQYPRDYTFPVIIDIWSCINSRKEGIRMDKISWFMALQVIYNIGALILLTSLKQYQRRQTKIDEIQRRLVQEALARLRGVLKRVQRLEERR